MTEGQMLEEAGFATITVKAHPAEKKRMRMRVLRKRFHTELWKRGLS